MPNGAKRSRKKHLQDVVVLRFSILAGEVGSHQSIYGNVKDPDSEHPLLRISHDGRGRTADDICIVRF